MTLSSHDLGITAVPEPVNVALGILGLRLTGFGAQSPGGGYVEMHKWRDPNFTALRTSGVSQPDRQDIVWMFDPITAK